MFLKRIKKKKKIGILSTLNSFGVKFQTTFLVSFFFFFFFFLNKLSMGKKVYIVKLKD